MSFEGGNNSAKPRQESENISTPSPEEIEPVIAELKRRNEQLGDNENGAEEVEGTIDMEGLRNALSDIEGIVPLDKDF